MLFRGNRKLCNLAIFALIVGNFGQTAFAYPRANSLSSENPVDAIPNQLAVTSESSDMKRSNNGNGPERKARHIIGGGGFGGFVGGGFGGISAPIYATPFVHSVPVVNHVPVITSVPVIHTIPSYGVGYGSGYGGYGGYGGYDGGYGGYGGGYGGYGSGFGGYGGGYGNAGLIGGVGGIGFGKFSHSYHARGFGIGGGFIG